MCPGFGRSEGAAGSGSAPHYYVPPQIFRLWTMPGERSEQFLVTYSWRFLRSKEIVEQLGFKSEKIVGI